MFCMFQISNHTKHRKITSLINRIITVHIRKLSSLGMKFYELHNKVIVNSLNRDKQSLFIVLGWNITFSFVSLQRDV